MGVRHAATAQAVACSLSRRSPYCPPAKYALACASTRRAYLTAGQHGSLLAQNLVYTGGKMLYTDKVLC